MHKFLWHYCNPVEETQLRQPETNIITVGELNSCSFSMCTHSSISIHYAEIFHIYLLCRDLFTVQAKVGRTSVLLCSVFRAGHNNGYNLWHSV